MMKLTPSKALKEIGLLKENGCYIKSTVEYKIVETALKDYEQLKIVAKPLTDEEKKSINSVARRLKALEIIKEKKVDVWKLYDAINVSADAWKGHELHFYNAHFTHPNAQYRKLTQEEFDLLKEELK